MTTLPRSLAAQQVTIAILFIVAVFQAYLVVSSTSGLNLRGIAIIANPLGCMFTFLSIYPKFKQSAVRIPLLAIGMAFLIFSLYILLVQRFA